MFSSTTTRCTFGGILIAVSLIGFGQDSRRSLTARERETLSWIGSLETVDLTNRPYVEVFLHNDSPGPYRKWERLMGYRGFLLADGPESFRVWCLDLLPRRLEHGHSSSDDLSSHWVIERLDLEAGVRLLVAALEQTARKAAAESGQRGASTYVLTGDPVACDEALDPCYQAIVLASVCARRGRDDLAVRLCNAASTCPKKSRVRRPGRIVELDPDANEKDAAARAAETPSQLLSDEFANLLRGHCVRAFGEPDFSRAEILARHRRYLELFPKDDEYGEVAARAGVIEHMILEDQARQRRGPTESRSADQQVDDLIVQLRDVDEPTPLSSNSSNWPATPHAWRPDGAPSRLIRLGHRAVPRLIEALGDSRPTRCVEPDFGSFCRAEGHVNRVGTYAWAVLAEIAHLCFYGSQSTGWGTASVQAAARAWWDRVQAEGEAASLAAMLEADTADGGSNAIGPARRLARIDPERAITAIGDAIDHAGTIQLRGDLVIVYGGLPGDRVVPGLLRLVENAPDLRSRLEAAKALHRRGRTEGLAAMIREWSRDVLPPTGGAFYDDTNESWMPRHPFLDGGYGVWVGSVAGELSSFLASSNDPAAIAALIGKLARGSGLHRWAAMCAGLSTSAVPVPPGSSLDRLRSAVERMLIAELSDKAKSGTCLLPGGIEQRWCDEAARRLAVVRPSRYEFDWETSIEDRDRQIEKILRSWEAGDGPDSRTVTEPESKPAK